MPSSPPSPSKPSLSQQANGDKKLAQKQKHWIDPFALPNSGDISHVKGNVSDEIKQLVQNTFVSYGIGDDDCFAAAAGKEARFMEVHVSKKDVAGREKTDCTTVWEAIVTKSKLQALSWSKTFFIVS